jgi:hypothetical protein
MGKLIYAMNGSLDRFVETPDHGLPVGSCLGAGLGSDVAGPAQAFQLAPETLAGSALPADGPHSRRGRSHDRRAVVHVAGGGGRGPDPRFDWPHDLDDTLAIRNAGLHPITCANLGRRLRRRSVHEDVAALAQPRRERASLHQAHRAKPAIDSRLVRSAGIRHGIHDPTGREGRSSFLEDLGSLLLAPLQGGNGPGLDARPVSARHGRTAQVGGEPWSAHTVGGGLAVGGVQRTTR